MSDSSDWKEKYQNSIRQLDEMEADCFKLDELLRKTILRLLTTAKGQNPEQDEILSKIELHTKEKSNSELNQDLEELIHYLMPLGGAEKNTESVSNNANADLTHKQLLGLLKRLKLDSYYRSRVEELKSALQSLSDDQCVSQLAEIINHNISRCSNSQNSIQSVLIKFLDNLADIHANPEQLKELQSQLKKECVNGDSNSCVDEITGEIQILIHNINFEKVELENLIVDVTSQLNEISHALLDNNTSSLNGHIETEKLQEMVTNNFTSIRDKIESASDIDSLKAGVNDNLDVIKLGLDRFAHKEAERFQESEKRNERLRKKMEFMENESIKLQQKLTASHQKLMFDTLTGVRSRLSYDESLDKELARWDRFHVPFCYAILDIDHFKSINDNYGHNAGDKALRMVAKGMMIYIRKTDLLFRIGGEEFALLMSNTSIEDAYSVVEDVRASVKELKLYLKNEPVSLCLSAGLTEVSDGDNAGTIYGRADRSLYAAKKSGRDQLVVNG